MLVARLISAWRGAVYTLPTTMPRQLVKNRSTLSPSPRRVPMAKGIAVAVTVPDPPMDEGGRAVTSSPQSFNPPKAWHAKPLPPVSMTRQ